jgi:hypothetical protein
VNVPSNNELNSALRVAFKIGRRSMSQPPGESLREKLDSLVTQLIEQCAEDGVAPVTVLETLRDIIEQKRLIATEENESRLRWPSRSVH